MTALTATLLDPMLHALKRRDLRQIEHLPRLRLNDRRLRQIPSAALAALHRMQLGAIGILPTLQMMTLMAGLAAGLAPRASPQAAVLLSRRLRVPVQRRRPRGVARVPVKPSAQLREQRLKLSDSLSLLADQPLKLRVRYAA